MNYELSKLHMLLYGSLVILHGDIHILCPAFLSNFDHSFSLCQTSVWFFLSKYKAEPPQLKI